MAKIKALSDEELAIFSKEEMRDRDEEAPNVRRRKRRKFALKWRDSSMSSSRRACSGRARISTEGVQNIKNGKIEEQIELLKEKLRMIYQGEAFNGKSTKTARSHGKKFQVTIRQETSRILGNLGWAYMQQTNYAAAEVVYHKAQQIDPDANKASNLCLCLINLARFNEARTVLEDILQGILPGSDDPKSKTRAIELLKELESFKFASSNSSQLILEDVFIEGLDQLMNQMVPFRSRRLPIF
ncbi:protein SULFUR DEFICIENCY-INDUCED 1-like [Lycium ferocissimum]|uniref:protein SULFUR DEFICIENCY-INDUCED 1-like n=1 Tax=Lycium ferocissimum TaxID=112874 RepID=UPI0028160EA7|nr:protein SULFUR DEFICIENCY-INDUCED 1-like [Lycium ferocissimum]